MMSSPQTQTSSGSYGRLLTDGGFQSFLWTQFLGAFNDNVYKMIVSIMALRIAADQQAGSRYLALAGAVFVIPYLLFAGPAGQLADRFSKTRVLQSTKAFEILIMLTGIGALLSHRIEPLLLVLFLLAMQANFFSPAKYGILPEMLAEAQLSRANGLLELTTFVAIVVGTSFGTLLFEHWQGAPLKIGLTLLVIALAGSAASLRITYTPASGSREPFHWNPLHEVVIGVRSLWKRRALWRTVIGISWFWFLGGLFQMALLLLGRETLHASETRVGLLVTALALGIGVGSVLAGRISGDHVELGLVPVGSALMGVFSVALGMTHSYGWALAWLAGVGCAGGFFIVPLNAYLQDRAPAEEKGRLLATNNFLNMLGVVLASGILWMLHDKMHWSAAQVIVALGAVTIGGTVYVTWILPDTAVRFILWSIVHILFRVRIVGSERIPRQGGAVIIANHVSWADAVLVGCATPRFVRFLMWQPYYETPFLRPFYALLHAIPLPTNSPKNSIRALRYAREELERGELVGIFPEGSLTRTGHVMPFQRGFEKVLNGAGAPMIPVYLDGLWGHPLSMKGGRLLGNWHWPRRRRVTVYVGEPIPGSTSPAEARDARCGSRRRSDCAEAQCGDDAGAPLRPRGEEELAGSGRCRFHGTGSDVRPDADRRAPDATLAGCEPGRRGAPRHSSACLGGRGHRKSGRDAGGQDRGQPELHRG